ncbi:MAG TPA: WD40 repeat domain-containing serine/threonine protein kinase, partial [Gemmataceae bacterium]|nr:WD40 repeat domain-containing serine/threonine protein kinase [Gemmataceae bacterium]
MPKPPLRRLEEVFHQAVAVDPPQRPAFLDAACAGDPELRAAVEELLKHDRDDAGSDKFLRSPLADQVERLRPLLPTILDVVQNRPGPASPTLPTVAGYELLEELGRGGMGVVYKARQISLDRIVALKMLLASELAATEQLVRFRTEAEALARLHHPNIVTIFEIAESEGRPYFTMEYVAGPSLADLLHGHPQDVAASAQLLEIVARAVHAVHQCGIVHRDLKPANVLLRKKPELRGPKPESEGGISDFDPKITDFGLAKDRADGRKLTVTGMTMGTPSYMAPEQARGSTVTGPATDVYALGSILYEMLTGRPPFDAGGPAETMAQLLQDEPVSPYRLRPNLPRDVVTICLKCLEKSPRKRYETSLELAEDLRRFQAGEPIHARPVSFVERGYRWCRRRPLVAGLWALSALLAVALIATVIVYEERLNRELQAQVRAEKEQIVQLHVQFGISAMEDGESFAAVIHFTEALNLDKGSEREHLHRTRIGTVLRQCPQLKSVFTLDRQVLCAEHELVVTVDANLELDAWSMQTALPVVSGSARIGPHTEGKLSPDGHFLGLIDGGGTARILDLLRNEPHELSTAGHGGVQRLIFHPGGRVLLVRWTDGTMDEWDLTTWKQLHWEGFTGGASLAAISDDGRWLLTCDADHCGQVWDLGTGNPVGSKLDLGQHALAGSVATDGNLVAVAGRDNDLWTWDVLAGRRLGKPIRLPGAVSRIDFSPDARRLATIGHDRILRTWETQAGSLLAESSPLDDTTTLSRFSGDGRYLLTIGEGGEVRVWDASTGQAVTPRLHPGGRLSYAAFRAGGQELVTVSKGGRVCRWELPHGPEVQRDAESGTARSPGSQVKPRSISLANGITVQTTGGSDGELKPAPRGQRIVEHAVVSPDGTRVVVCEDSTTVQVWPTTGAEASPLPLRHRSPVRHAAFSAAGTRILTACEDRTVRLWDAATGELLAPPMRHA